jgi:hypothetical protein
MRSESENNIMEVDWDLSYRFNYRRHPESYNTRISRNHYLQSDLYVSNKKYSTPSNYINLETMVNFDYRYEYSDASYSCYSDYEANHRTYEATILAGFGKGKVRDITPVIRALRFKKRYNSLGKSNLTDQEIENLAEVMATYSGYSYVYDRSSKKFWNAAFNTLGNKMVEMDGYETFFVTEALSEQVGSRLEGSDVNFNIQYTRVEENNDGKYYDYVYSYAGPVLQARVYSNLSTRYQISFDLEASYLFGISDLKPFENVFLSVLNHSQLFTITDRLIYTFNGYLTTQNYNYEVGDNKGFIVEIFNDFSYYLEDNLTLSLFIDYLFQKFDHDTIDNSYYYSSSDFYDNLYKEYGEWDFGLSLNYRLRSM